MSASSFTDASSSGPDSSQRRTSFQRSGVSLKYAQVLARHSDPKLTQNRYTHARLAELGEAVGGIDVVANRAALPLSWSCAPLTHNAGIANRAISSSGSA